MKIKFFIISIISLIYSLSAQAISQKEYFIENYEITTLNYHTHISSLAKMIEYSFDLIKQDSNIDEQTKDIYLRFYLSSFNLTLKHMDLYKELKAFTINLRNSKNKKSIRATLNSLDKNTDSLSKSIQEFNSRVEKVAPILNRTKKANYKNYKIMTDVWLKMNETNSFLIEIKKLNLQLK